MSVEAATPRAADKGLIARLVEQGFDRADAFHIEEQVTVAILAQLKDGKGVRLNGIGVIKPKKRRRRLLVGPNRGQAVEDVVVALQFPATLKRGDPYYG